jgi:hypothetical protein
MRFKFFHLPAHRQYNYQPRFYNSRQKQQGRISEDKQKRLVMSMKEHLIQYRRAEEKNQRLRQIITFVTLTALFIIIYLIVKYFTKTWPI